MCQALPATLLQTLRSLDCAMTSDRVRFGRVPCAPGSASAPTAELESLSLTQLRAKARKTSGITERKKVDGKWVPKGRDDLLAEFKALQIAAAPSQTLEKPSRCPAIGISPRLRQLRRELSGTSDDSGEEAAAGFMPPVLPGSASTGGIQEPGSASSVAASSPNALEFLSLLQLRAIASRTPGMTTDKKTQRESGDTRSNKSCLQNFAP